MVGWANIIEVNWLEDFNNILKTSSESQDNVYIVDFWASWCGPCRMLVPILENIATEYAGKVKIVKINVETPDNQQLAMQFGVNSIPHVILIKAWASVDQFIWALPYDAVKDYIEKHI